MHKALSGFRRKLQELLLYRVAMGDCLLHQHFKRWRRARYHRNLVGKQRFA
jgi:hypothetical protein